MCGIAGVFDPSGSLTPWPLDRMLRLMRHRGPDGDGIRTIKEAGIALGACRLAIIDPSPAGSQPMSVDCPKCPPEAVLVFNGEIYNHTSIRKSGVLQDHKFAGHSDTETLLHLLNTVGPVKACGMHNGMFAFAYWDEKTLWLARDGFGQKPLYICSPDPEKPSSFAFASEIKAFYAFPKFVPRINHLALSEYLIFQNFFSDLSLFDGVRPVRPGTVVRATGGGASLDGWFRSFWEPRFETSSVVQEPLSSTLKDAVARHLVADVPVGSYISGGVDSSTIMANLPDPARVRTFTVGFDLSQAMGIERVWDESADAKAIARTFGTRHYETVVLPGDLGTVMDRLIFHLEEPRLGMCYSNWYAAELASKFVRVALSGVGGDEMFGGYLWRYPLIGKSPSDLKEWLWGKNQRALPVSMWEEALADETLNAANTWFPRASFDEAFTRADAMVVPGPGSIDRTVAVCQAFDILTFLRGLLHIEDRISMAHSLESRAPFLDANVAGAALALPLDAKIGPFHYGSDPMGKIALRELLLPKLGPKLAGKPKQGFSSPDGSWWAGPSRSYIESVLLDGKTANNGFFQERFVARTLDEHAAKKANHRLLIWSMLSLETWRRLFIADYRKWVGE